MLHLSACFSFVLVPLSTRCSSLWLDPSLVTRQIIRSKTDVKHVASLFPCYALLQSLPLFVCLLSVILCHCCQYFVNSCKTQGSLSPLLLSFFLLHLTPSRFTPATCPHLLKSWPASLSAFPSSISSPLFPPRLFLASSTHSGTAILPLMSITRYLVCRSYPATDWQALDNTAVNYWPVWSIETGLNKALIYICLVVCLFFKYILLQC